MFNFKFCYFHLLLGGYCLCHLKFHVERRADHKSGIEPYIPKVHFANTDPLCFFAYCWNKRGKCMTSFSCCECVCSNKRTFFSLVSGCLDGAEVVKQTRIAGLACKFLTTKARFGSVPLFTQSHKFHDITLVLPVDEVFPLSNEATQCDAGEVYIYDYHGHKLLYDRNECNELFILMSNNGSYNLQWQSFESRKWDMLKGQLISVDISCKNKQHRKSIKSCFVFQLEGKYTQGKHFQPPTPSTKSCHSTTPFTLNSTKTKITSPTKTTKMVQVERRAANKSGIEPYIPNVYFVNTNERCFFAYCWNKNARCSDRKSNCCECICNNRKTFFSMVSGCLDGAEVVKQTRIAGLACKFLTTKARFGSVPLFTQSHKFHDIEMGLPLNETFPLSSQLTKCDAGEVYIYDYHGNKLLYDRNVSHELFILKSYHGSHYLKWQSLESKKWDMLKGQLISVDISCKNKEQGESLKSCFVFQVEGK